MREKRILAIALLVVITLSAVTGIYILTRPRVSNIDLEPAAAPEGSGSASLAPVTPVRSDDDIPPADNDDFRGLWVATVLNLDYPSAAGVSVDKLKSEADKILDSAADMGFTAVILQVRPCGDAFYKSDIFPWSYYLTGNQGAAPANGFDPLEYWVEEAHERGLELHAWVNPFRVTRGSVSAPKHDLTNLAKTNPARLNPDWVIKYHDGNMYYDPGIPEARELIIDGVVEIIEKYDVDGVHYDDYFYPGTDFPDDESYNKYGAAYENRDDWRRDNINKLIKETGEAVAKKDATVRYGVSPFAIWQNKSSDSLGSDTSGNESYKYQYADTRKWVKSGWVDYICPQIYWEIGYNIADYQKVLNWWVDVVRDTGVDLYVGLASYRSGNTTAGSAWQGTAEIERQLAMNSANPEVKGSVHFRYAFFAEYKPLYDAVKSFYHSGETQPAAPVGSQQLYIGRPSANVTTTYDKYYILGASDPTKPVYMNGQAIDERTPEGYFGVMVNLKSGANSITFTQGDKTETRVITRGSSGGSSSPATQSKAEIISGSAYPDVYNEYRQPGETVTLSCKAPIGAKLTVTINGKTYDMTPAQTTAPGTSYIYTTTFKYSYKIPEPGATGTAVNLGAPVYTMTYAGKTSKVTATGDVVVLTANTPYYATVNVDEAYIYDGMTTTGGPSGILAYGQKDRILAVSENGKWVKLAMGKWILRANVERKMESTALNFGITNVGYSFGEKFQKLSFDMNNIAASKTAVFGDTLIFTVYNTTTAKTINLPGGSIFSSVTSASGTNCVIYTFTVAPGKAINGYYTETENGVLNLYVAPRPVISAGRNPLAGFTIMLDAGHGGSDTGALGPLGAKLGEKDIALQISQKMKTELEALGATVIMTRSGDSLVTLQERLDQCRAVMPDMFISVHLNAMEVNVDCANINGISMWYREDVSEDFADSLYKHLYTDLNIPKRGLHQSNLFVCRPTWTPSVIIETGFISNPYDYEWLANANNQSRMAASLADWVLEYFS